MYNYYYIKTDCRSNCWDTPEIRELLLSHGMEDRGSGVFVRQNPFLDISLMKVKDLNIWSSRDYDPQETNYVSIVTSFDGKENPEIMAIFKELEYLLCFRICPDDCEREVTPYPDP